MQDASPSEIKSAFKKLTLKLHPDKNDSPDADVQFRNLVSVHNILKDPGKREKYVILESTRSKSTYSNFR